LELWEEEGYPLAGGARADVGFLHALDNAVELIPARLPGRIRLPLLVHDCLPPATCPVALECERFPAP
jgi:hypothetical protein